MYDTTKKMLIERGVDLERLGELVVDLQKKYSPGITQEIAMENIEAVLRKRETQNAVMTGISIDILAEKKMFPEPLQGILERDEGLYGPDEALAEAIAHCYGSIASSNFGFLDISKPGIIGEFNDKQKKPDQVHTFLDDLLCGIVAAACSRYAHNQIK
jgi:phosphatidylglycerophosphatase A